MVDTKKKGQIPKEPADNPDEKPETVEETPVETVEDVPPVRVHPSQRPIE